MGDRAALIRRRVVWPLALVLLMSATGTALANTASEELPVAAPLTARWAGEVNADAWGQVLAPEPTAAPAAPIPQIQIVFPPPPPPPAASGGRRGGSGGSGSGRSYPLLDAVNSVRASAGQAPLTWSQSLANGATSWSRTMCADHDAALAGGSSIEQGWVTAFRHDTSFSGYRGENIYAAYGDNMSLGAAHREWVNSPGHYSNIIEASFTEFGVGSCTSANGVYFATERFR